MGPGIARATEPYVEASSDCQEVQVCGEGSEREAEKVTLIEKRKARGVKSARALWRGGERVGIRKHVEHDWEKGRVTGK